jgi:DNA-binding IclR family transcriptional regulator
MKNKEEKYQAPALEKGLEIIEYLSLKAIALSQAEIANGIHKKPNEIYRMLVCLERTGYVMRDEISGKYKLTLKLFHLSHRHSPVDDIRRAAQYLMDELASEINQSCHLSILYAEKLMVIAQARSPGPVSLSIAEGSLFPLLETTSGRVLLAFTNADQRNHLLRHDSTYQNKSAKEKKQILTMLDVVQNAGYLIKDSDSTRSVTDICVPLLSSQNDLLATLTVAALTARDESSANFEAIAEHTKAAAAKILARLGVR